MEGQFALKGTPQLLLEGPEESLVRPQAFLHVERDVELRADEGVDQTSRDLAGGVGEGGLEDHHPLPTLQKKVGQNGTGQSMADDKEVDHVPESIPHPLSSCEQILSMTGSW